MTALFTTKYVKEDLPTYSELLNEFWNQRYWESRALDPYDRKWQEVDPYWEIPRYKVLLATACNQFNKMMYLDRIITVKDIYPHFATEYGLGYDMTDFIHFYRVNQVASVYVGNMCNWRPHFAISTEGVYQTPVTGNPYARKDLMDEEHIPPIYELSLPSGKPNPFIISDYHILRLKVNELQGMIELRFVWNSTEGFYATVPGMRPIDMIWDCTHPRFKNLLQTFMKPIEEAMK